MTVASSPYCSWARREGYSSHRGTSACPSAQKPWLYLLQRKRENEAHVSHLCLLVFTRPAGFTVLSWHARLTEYNGANGVAPLHWLTKNPKILFLPLVHRSFPRFFSEELWLVNSLRKGPWLTRNSNFPPLKEPSSPALTSVSLHSS